MPSDEEQLELVSDLLFGRPIRLHVARWILRRRRPDFFESELTHDLPLRFGSNCRDVLYDMVELNMLRYFPKATVEGRNRVYYERLPHPLWECLRLAVKSARSQGARKSRPESARSRRARVATR
jgi:hypothetical protein